MHEMTETLLVNRYKIIDKIGEGGMGRVWRVYDTVEQREVALKQFYKKTKDSDTSITQKGTVALETVRDSQIKGIHISTLATPTTEEGLRFKQEFLTMVKLKHPNTVNVFDYGVLENGDDYLTMEIVPGQELRDILKERQLNFDEIYRILIQTAQVLNFIHSRLLVHRDIKPSNIRITPEGNVKLMDFGLMEQMGLPSNGEITGTVIYLPPEAAKGGIIDARSDLYSLGVMAYELVTGQPPFIGKEALDIIRQHIEIPPIPPRQIRQDTPEELQEIILRLLAKEQSERYQTTAELINDLVQLTAEKIAVETLEQRKSYLNCSELIGREREMQELKDAFTLTTQEKSQGIFIAAPAGVGKSRLIQEFKLKVQLERIPFMQGQCFEQGMTAYQPLASAFKPLLPLTKREILDKYGSVLVKVIPELRSKGYEPAPRLEEAGEKARLFEQITGWLRELSKSTPIVICIEDLHWSDFATLELLNACIRELQDYPIMILGAFRDDEIEETSILYHTVEEKITNIMKLSTLTQDNVQSLIKGMLGRIELTEDFTEHVYTATAGNAFFVSEVMRSLIEEEQLRLERGRWVLPADISALELPTSIGASIIRRLNLLNPEALKLARIAAIVGRGLDLSFLKELTGLEDDKLFDILDELIERQFMKKEERYYVFTHDRVRETLYNQLEEEKKKEMHERVGTIIETRFTDNKGPVINELAYHFDRGLNRTKAAYYLIQAGDSIKGYGDVARATKLYARALEILDTIDYPNKTTVAITVRDNLLITAFSANPALTIMMSERQRDELKKLVNIEKVVKVMRVIFKIIDMLPKRVSVRLKEKLTKQRPKDKIGKDIGTILFFILRACGCGAIASGYIGDTSNGWKLIEESNKYVPDFKSSTYALLTTAFITIYQYLGLTKSFQQRVEHSIDIMDTIKRYGLLTDPFYKYCYAALLSERLLIDAWVGKDLDQDLLKRATEYCESENFLEHQYWVQAAVLDCLNYRGKYKAYREESEKAKELLRKLGRPIFQEVNFWAYPTRLESLLHHYEKAVEAMEKLYTLAKNSQSKYMFHIAEIYKAVLKFQQGQREEGITQMKEVIEVITKANFFCHTEAMTWLAEMYLELGDIGQAWSILAQAEDFMNQKFEEPQMFFKGKMYLLRSEIARRKKEFEKAQNILQEVIAISDETDNPLLKAMVSEQKAKVCMDLTQWDSAKNSLVKAKTIYDDLGAEKRKREIEELLRSIKE